MNQNQYYNIPVWIRKVFHFVGASSSADIFKQPCSARIATSNSMYSFFVPLVFRIVVNIV